jgi:hypothetical protein
MRHGFCTVTAAIAATAGLAGAGDIFVGAHGDTTLLADNFANAGLAGNGVSSTLYRQFGASPAVGNTVDFGAPGGAGSSVATFAADSGTYYLGAASGLTSNWFNGAPTPAGPTTTLAFGQNSGLTAHAMTITFAPGVLGFGFNFNDVGDQGGEFTVEFNDGTSVSVSFLDGGGVDLDPSTYDQQSGYIALIASAGKEITSVRLTQPTDVNDGLSLYNFSTMVVVPLPPAAWAGLAMIGGIAGVRRLRRR